MSASYHSSSIFVPRFRAIGAGGKGAWSSELRAEVEGRWERARRHAVGPSESWLYVVAGCTSARAATPAAHHRNVLHYDTLRKVLESYRNYKRIWQNMTEHCPELNGNTRKQLETTVSYRTQAWLTPTLTHVIMRNPVTSGAEDRAMSFK